MLSHTRLTYPSLHGACLFHLYDIYIYTYLYIDLYNIHHLHVIIIIAYLSFSWTMGLCFDLQTTSPYDTVSFMVGHMFRSGVLYYKPKAHITQKVFSRDFLSVLSQMSIICKQMDLSADSIVTSSLPSTALNYSKAPKSRFN